MNLQTNNYFIGRLVSQTLHLLDKDTLKELFTAPRTSCFILTPSTLIYASLDFEIFSLNLYSLEKSLIFVNSEITTTLFFDTNKLYLGMNSGKIVQYIVHEDEDDVLYRQVEEYTHTAPILSLVSDGEDVVVSDMKDRLTLYPTSAQTDYKGPLKVSQYDLKATQLVFKEYVFVSESNKLFCKTRQAMASLLETQTKIHEFRFNEGGGALFIRLFDRIQVYNTNTRELLKEIELVVDNFYYCDRTNCLVGWTGKEVRRVCEVLEGVPEEMKGITFDRSKIVVKTVGVPFEEGETERKVMRTRVFKEGVSKEGVLKQGVRREGAPREVQVLQAGRHTNQPTTSPTNQPTHSPATDKLKGLFQSDVPPPEKKKKTVIDFKEDLIEEGESSRPTLDKGLPITNGSSTLLWYSQEGFLTSIKGRSYNKVELKYHDISMPSIEIEDSNFCSKGVFCSKAIVLYSLDGLYFYSGSKEWSKNINPKLVCLTEKYVLVYSKIVQLFDYNGEEVFNFNVGEVQSACMRDNKVAVFSHRRLVVLDLFRGSQSFDIPGSPTWSFIDDSANIFYTIGGELYVLYLGVSYRLLEDVCYPLVVSKDKLICLKSKDLVLPVPHLEFRGFKFTVREEAIEESSFEEEGGMNESRGKRFNPLDY